MPNRTTQSGAPVVGRQSEVKLFGNLVAGKTAYRTLNIYGPGGIGKTVVGHKLSEHAAKLGVPLAAIDGIQPDLTPEQILSLLAQGLVTSSASEIVEDHFRQFSQQHQDYSTIHQILLRFGGLTSIYDVVGTVKEPALMMMMAEQFGEQVTSFVNETLANRFQLERYQRSAVRELTASFIHATAACLDSLKRPVSLLLDTYEEMEEVDDWVCRDFVPYLPEETRLVILGRNQLHKVNFDWNDVGDNVHSMPLPELEEEDAKAYLRYFGLTDKIALSSIYQFTGGYPLLLVLVRHLAKEAGGWDQVGALEANADRDRIASQLLDRILREERVSHVQTFLEKGVVASWFDPEIIQVILEVNLAEARDIYEKLRPHSFVERHPYGLKFHDKIRELLRARLKFTSESEYERLESRLMEYHRDKASIDLELIDN